AVDHDALVDEALDHATAYLEGGVHLRHLNDAGAPDRGALAGAERVPTPDGERCGDNDNESHCREDPAPHEFTLEHNPTEGAPTSLCKAFASRSAGISLDKKEGYRARFEPPGSEQKTKGTGRLRAYV